jgi:hypothetical protein
MDNEEVVFELTMPDGEKRTYDEDGARNDNR